MTPIPLGMQSDDSDSPDSSGESGGQEFPSVFIQNAPSLPDEGTITFKFKKSTPEEESAEGEAGEPSDQGGVELEFSEIVDVSPAEQADAPSDDSSSAAFDRVAAKVRTKKVAPPRDDSDEMPA